MSEKSDPNCVHDDSAAPPSNVDEQDNLTLGQMFGSALAAMVGVQSKQRRERDFSRGRASHFIVVGLVVTTIFVLTMAAVVTLVMSVAT